MAKETWTDLLPLTDAGKGTLAVMPDETTTYTLRAVGDEAVNVLHAEDPCRRCA